jgi:RNA polymerase sigma-70 factor (ECF subfamily)
MTQDNNREATGAGERAGISEDERQEKLAQLRQRHSKLSPDEAALLEEEFPSIIAAHRTLVSNLLRKQRVESHEVEDLCQEVFLTLHNELLENGFVDDLAARLRTLATGKGSNHVRAQDRAPFTNGTPSSTSEKPRSQLDVEHALHIKKVARLISSQLSPEHKEVLNKVFQKGLTHTEAAEALGIPEGTLKSRLLAAKRAFAALAEQLVPLSQRGPV